ncbi:MAG TPA: hypothetical protein VGK44_11255 [Casimicrobiaceae bacterium]
MLGLLKRSVKAGITASRQPSPSARRGSGPTPETPHEGTDACISEHRSHVVERNFGCAEKLTRDLEAKLIEDDLKCCRLRLQSPIQRTPVHRQYVRNVVARALSAQEQDSQCAIDLLKEPRATLCASLLFGNPQANWFGVFDRTIHPRSGKPDRADLGVEPRLNLEELPVHRRIARRSVRKQYLGRRPSRTAELAKKIDARRKTGVAERLQALELTSIDCPTKLDDIRDFAHERHRAFAVEVLIKGKSLQRIANGRRLPHQFADDAEIGQVPHAPGDESEMRTSRSNDRFGEQRTKRREWDSVLGIVQCRWDKTRSRERVNGIRAKSPKQHGQHREGAHALNVGSGRPWNATRRRRLRLHFVEQIAAHYSNIMPVAPRTRSDRCQELAVLRQVCSYDASAAVEKWEDGNPRDSTPLLFEQSHTQIQGRAASRHASKGET